MHYCDPCGEKRKWPVSGFRTYGPCEICGRTGECNDVHHSNLPEPPKPEPKVKLSFGLIDARDDEIIGIMGPKGFAERPKSEHNVKIINTAVIEYLRDLKKLQDSIVYRFEQQLIDDTNIRPENAFCQTKCPCKDSSDKMSCDIGNELSNLYYT